MLSKYNEIGFFINKYFTQRKCSFHHIARYLSLCICFEFYPSWMLLSLPFVSILCGGVFFQYNKKTTTAMAIAMAIATAIATAHH